jgi:hypothetical protein
VSGLLPAFGGGANSVVQLAAGGLSGVLGMSALIASGVVAPSPPAADPQTLALVGCPGSGSVVAVARPGDQMLVTGRSADGAWLQVYVPGPAGNDGWVPAATVNLLADSSALPIADCAVAAATATPGPTAAPATATPTAIATATSTAKPTPSPTPTPTATPNVGPLLASLKASRGTIYADRPGHCEGDPASLSISVTATDADGVASATLYWKPAGSSSYRSKAMSSSGRLWKATLSTRVSGDQLTAKGTVAYYVVAKDADGAQTRSPATAKTFKVAPCNHAPAVGNIDFGGEIYHGEYPCTTTFFVSLAGVIDPDNDPITSVLFWYRAYGMKTYASATLVGDPAVPGFYSATVYTANWPPMPGTSPTYSIPWYVTATDALGATRKYVNPNSPLIENYCFVP